MRAVGGGFARFLRRATNPFARFRRHNYRLSCTRAGIVPHRRSRLRVRLPRLLLVSGEETPTMNRRLSYLAVAALTLTGTFAHEASAQSQAVLAQLYGRGVHAYYAGQYNDAYNYLSSAIGAGTQDPACLLLPGHCPEPIRDEWAKRKRIGLKAPKSKPNAAAAASARHFRVSKAPRVSNLRTDPPDSPVPNDGFSKAARSDQRLNQIGASFTAARVFGHRFAIGSAIGHAAASWLRPAEAADEPLRRRRGHQPWRVAVAERSNPITHWHDVWTRQPVRRRSRSSRSGRQLPRQAATPSRTPKPDSSRSGNDPFGSAPAGGNDPFAAPAGRRRRSVRR